MKKIFTTQADPILFQQLQNELTEAGISCFVKNENPVGAAAGEVPPIVCWPELWIRDESQTQKAMALIEAVQSGPAKTDIWQCPHCGISLEPQFTDCWQCSAQA